MSFPQFNRYVLPGDSVEFTDPDTQLRFVATLFSDDSADAPDQRSDGFWPSMEPEDPGYIGSSSRKAFDKARALAKAVYDAWKDGDWFYVGVSVSVWKQGIRLTQDHAHALWGIEANYPGSKGNPYLAEVANNLVVDAKDAALAKLAELAPPPSDREFHEAYVRLRSIIPGAFDTPPGPTAEEVWEHTEACLRNFVNNAQLAEKKLRELKAFAKKQDDAMTSKEEVPTGDDWNALHEEVMST